jgi:hypothetical protein
MTLREWEKETKVPVQYSDINKEIKLLLDTSMQTGVTIGNQKNKFDPRKSKQLTSIIRALFTSCFFSLTLNV